MITVTIVLFHTQESMLDNALECLLKVQEVSKIYLIDNSSMPRENILGMPINSKELDERISYYFANANLGYSKGHNVILDDSSKRSKYHLVMNADILFEPGTIENILNYMDSDDDVGLLMPRILNSDKSIQHQPKLLPTPMNLFARRFLPNFISR